MTSNFFPTDVRLVVDQGLDAQSMIGAARHVLFHALHVRESGGVGPISVRERLPGGVVITAFLFGISKVVTIRAPSYDVKREPPKPEEPTTTPRLPDDVVMLSGWIRGGREVTVGGKTALDSFRPTASCAKAYNLNPDFHKNTKLVTGGTSLRYMRGSLFSGTMKRVVQAILGLGIVRDSSPEYISGVPNPETERPIQVTYEFDWVKTHGVVKAGTKNHWLVEVSRDNGVIAMPLPLFSLTKDAGYRKRASSRGDVDTVRVLDEFGGIPSGESFPLVRADVLSAIDDGKIIELLPPEGIAPFYSGKKALSYGQGWAFSENIKQVHNTCIGLEDGTIVSTKTNLLKKYIFGEHWALSLTLSPHNLANLALNQPVGTGSATLQRYSRGKIDPFELQYAYAAYPGTTNVVPSTVSIATPDADKLEVLSDAWWPPGTNIKDPLPPNGWGAVLWVFFDGDLMRRVKWVPQTYVASGIEIQAGTVPTSEVLAYRSRNITNPKSIACMTRDAYLEAPYYFVGTYSAESHSPSAFVVEGLDMRRLDGYGPDRDYRWIKPECSQLPLSLIASNYIERYTYVEPPNGCYAVKEVHPVDVATIIANKMSSAHGNPQRPPDGHNCYSRFGLFVTPYSREGYMITMNRRESSFQDTCARNLVTTALHDRTFIYITGRGNVETRESSPRIPVAAASKKYSVGLIRNAGPKQEFVFTDNKWSTDSSAKPLVSQVLPSSLIGLPPEDVNWVGSV